MTLSLNNGWIRLGSWIRKLLLLRYRIMGVRIEGNVWISRGARIDITVRNRITIKSGCVITQGATILAHDRASWRLRSRLKDDGLGFVVLEEGVFVGVNAIILRNVTVGRNSIIGAAAVVTKDVPPNSLVAGNPAKVIGTVPPRETLMLRSSC